MLGGIGLTGDTAWGFMGWAHWAMVFTVNVPVTVREVELAVSQVGWPEAAWFRVGFTSQPGTDIYSVTWLGRSGSIDASSIGPRTAVLETPVLLVPGVTYYVVVESVIIEGAYNAGAGRIQASNFPYSAGSVTGVIATSPGNFGAYPGHTAWPPDLFLNQNFHASPLVFKGSVGG